MANRVSFVVDGFNLYHSLRKVSSGPRAVAARWLDLRALCAAYLHVIGNGATLEGVYYFSALAKHLEAKKPGLVARHEAYADVLRSTGVHVEFANFLKKEIRCPACRAEFSRHEEKQTDVAVGVKILELAIAGISDTIVVVSADSDIIPAVRTTRRLFPALRIFAAFPVGKGSKQLRMATHQAFSFSTAQYAKHQLPNVVTLPSGRVLTKPPKW